MKMQQSCHSIKACVDVGFSCFQDRKARPDMRWRSAIHPGMHHGGATGRAALKNHLISNNWNESEQHVRVLLVI